jgi:cyclic pyranopterin monophosphate synthase
MSSQLTHLSDEGRAQMVAIGEKSISERHAVAEGRILMQYATLALVREGLVKKGDVLTIARIAGITGAKKTADLIPLCHPLALTHIHVDCVLDETLPGIHVKAGATVSGKTGVEMEALTAVSMACLTLWDMLKGIDSSLVIENIRLISKTGGRTDFSREASL